MQIAELLGHPLTTVRPHPSGGGAIVSNPVLRECRPATADELVRAVRAGVSPSEAAAWDPDWTRWSERGWRASLDFYLWTRDLPSERSRKVLANPESSRGSKLDIELPRPIAMPEETRLGDLLMRRKSHRAFKRRAVSAVQLASVLEQGSASSQRIGTPQLEFDFYVVAYNVEGVSPGAYCFDGDRRVLNLRQPGRHRKAMCEVMYGMSTAQTAAFSVVLVMNFERMQKLGLPESALRQVWIESGRVAQYLILSGMAFGMGSLVTPALREKVLCPLLGISGIDLAPVYSVTMGVVA